ncbi:hypothetical protein PLICRDRAFT_45605 [Plicaturopsis crispa FD-325 SS-3]|uniref:Uncharacterized protein n=1 Tax=Plicaturopsis crispa FD-325 SS-3 TaxID=944288 RepID=A0A0C9SY55_PLICR|nr:hypothetical protein PLICRDRAFT_45605 [Plicaturopsis crispa FD-325 SS-3]
MSSGMRKRANVAKLTPARRTCSRALRDLNHITGVEGVDTILSAMTLCSVPTH